MPNYALNQGCADARAHLGLEKVAYSAKLTRRILGALDRMGMKNGPPAWGAPGALHVPGQPGILERLGPEEGLNMKRTRDELERALRHVRPLSVSPFPPTGRSPADRLRIYGSGTGTHVPLAKRRQDVKGALGALPNPTAPTGADVDKMLLSGVHGPVRGPFQLKGPTDLKPHDALQQPGTRPYELVWKGAPRHSAGYNPNGTAWVSPMPNVSAGYTYGPGGWLEAYSTKSFDPKPQYTPHIAEDTRGWPFDKIKAARRGGSTAGKSAISNYPYYEGTVTQGQLDAAKPVSRYRRGHEGFYHIGGEDLLLP